MVISANDNDWLIANINCAKAPGLRDQVSPACDLPRVAKDSFVLDIEETGIQIKMCRQGASLREIRMNGIIVGANTSLLQTL